MKFILFLGLLLTACAVCHSQLIKKILNDAKNQTEWKVRSKANQKVDQALDSLLTHPKKETDKKKNSQSEKRTNQNAAVTENASSSTKETEEMNIGEGFIKLYVSANEVFKGGTIAITGNSVKYGSLEEVKMTITGGGVNEAKTLKLYENGSFATSWQTEKSGEFTIAVASSDGKDRKSEKVTVYDIELMDDWTNENKEETTKAHEQVKKQVSKIESAISKKDKDDLDKRMQQLADDVNLAQNFFDELNHAVKELGKTKTALPSALKENLSQLNDMLSEHRKQTKGLRELADHEPYDNTICEYLVMVNEACAAFSTFTNLLGSVGGAILMKIAKDNTPLGQMENKKSSSNDYSGVVKTPATLFVDSKLSAEKITAGRFTADVMNYATNYLLKKYCGVISGTLSHDYDIVYRNKLGTPWWKYNYKTEAAINLRYPKTSSGGKIIKMKGSIEGNATLFDFYQDVEQMDDFKEQMKGRAKLTPLLIHKPVALPFSSTQFKGLGAVAKGTFTPSYFYIPIDAEYDVDANTMKLFLNEPMIDFSTLVNYTYGYIGIAAGIPLVTRVTFPINKAKLTLNAVVSQNNELTVTNDAKNSLNITGKGDRHIGSETSEIEHKIRFTLTAKSEK